MLTLLAAPPGGRARQEPDHRLKDLLLLQGTVVWLDLERPSEEELQLLSRVFEFHPLAVEDCRARVNHPKIDDYGRYLYLVVHGVLQAERPEELSIGEIDCFLGPNYVVTVHDGAFANIRDMRRRSLEVEGAMGRGADWLLHEILDRLVTTHLALIDRVDAEIDVLDRDLFRPGPPSRRALGAVFRLKRQLSRVKRVVHPARDVFGRIARQEYRIVRPEVAPHFRDVYDHLVRVSEMIESFRDTLGSAVETHLAYVSQRTNEIVKVLTVFSAILMTTSLMAGLYGMNFRFLPGSESRWGFWGMAGAMVAVSGVLLAIFRRQKWI